MGFQNCQAETNRVTRFSYLGNDKVKIETSELPINTTWKVQYAPKLEGTNTVWKDYANVLQGGQSNSVTLYSPVAERYFRLRQR